MNMGARIGLLVFFVFDEVLRGYASDAKLAMSDFVFGYKSLYGVRCLTRKGPSPKKEMCFVALWYSVDREHRDHRERQESQPL